MFVRKKHNQSGSISIQILQKIGRKNRLIKTVGSSKDPVEIENLYRKAHKEIERLTHQPTLPLLPKEDLSLLYHLSTLSNTDILPVGAPLVFGRVFDEMGFGAIEDELFRTLVLSRIVYPGSKLKLVDYLRRYERRTISVGKIYRFLDKLHKKYKETIEQIAFAYTKKVLGSITVVFYDMSTLYFEAQDEDDFRKIGFSKDGKFQNPQIMIGLLVGEKGYPIGYELFEGNTFEGHTLIPVLEAFEKKFGLSKPVVVADSGLLSNKNIEALESKGYGYIIGARIKKSDRILCQKITALNLKEDGEFGVIEQAHNRRLILGYSQKRAQKDAHNRKKGLQRLEKRLRSGKLTKESINARGYNKYLKLENSIKVTINYARYEEDAKWDGLKGYLTNTDLSPSVVTENYANLWQIEKAFRMNKSDLMIRPVYHFARRRIEAHICIVFVAYSIYKEMERLLYKYHAPFSVKTAREIVQHMYEIRVTLPQSKMEEKIQLKMDEEQQRLLDILQAEFG